MGGRCLRRRHGKLVLRPPRGRRVPDCEQAGFLNWLRRRSKAHSPQCNLDLDQVWPMLAIGPVGVLEDRSIITITLTQLRPRWGSGSSLMELFHRLSLLYSASVGKALLHLVTLLTPPKQSVYLCTVTFMPSAWAAHRLIDLIGDVPPSVPPSLAVTPFQPYGRRGSLSGRARSCGPLSEPEGWSVSFD